MCIAILYNVLLHNYDGLVCFVCLLFHSSAKLKDNSKKTRTLALLQFCILILKGQFSIFTPKFCWILLVPRVCYSCNQSTSIVAEGSINKEGFVLSVCSMFVPVPYLKLHYPMFHAVRTFLKKPLHFNLGVVWNSLGERFFGGSMTSILKAIFCRRGKGCKIYSVDLGKQ